jgi:hypothetical protein
MISCARPASASGIRANTSGRSVPLPWKLPQLVAPARAPVEHDLVAAEGTNELRLVRVADGGDHA